MKTLKSFRADIESAEDLLRQAQTDYADAVMKAVEQGTLVEIVISNWRSRILSSGNSIEYCTKCGAINSCIRSNYCPNCGAHMSNGKYIPKFVEVDTVDKLEKDIEREFNTTKDVSAKTIIKDLRNERMNLSKIAELLNVSVSVVSKWANGVATPTDSNLKKLRELYRTTFNREVEEPIV